MVETCEPAAQVLSDVATEERCGAEAPVLGDVRELVGEEPERVGGRIFHARRRRPRQEDAPAEDDRARARERGQEAGQPAAVEPGGVELGGELRAELFGEDGGNPVAGH